MAVLIVLAVIAVFVLLLLAKTVRVIPQARAGVVERLGRYSRTLTPGLTLVIPFIDRVRPLLDLRERALGDEQVGVGAAEEAVDNWVDDERADFQTELPLERSSCQQVEAGRIGQRVNEFAVSQLLDRGNAYFDDGSQKTR